ncbi:ATP-binding protein [Bacillus tianshenii]|nr:ATP-binding protein [Bacillus tianshenii]
MKKKVLTLLICILLYAGLYEAFWYFTNQKKDDIPIATQGVVHINEWDFEDKGAVPLKGEWEFYPRQLLTPEDFRTNVQENPQFVYVPSVWPVDSDDTLTKFGYATYRLMIDVKHEGELFGLKTNIIRMSNRIYFNGKEIGRSGVPAIKQNYSPENTPYLRYFPLRNGQNEIIVQVANYDYMAGGGIASPIYFGPEKQISNLRDMSLMHDFMTITALLVMGLYLLGLFVQRREDKSLIVFSIYCVSLSVFSALHGEKILYLLFPDLPYRLVLSLQFSTALLGAIALSLYLYSSFTSFCSKWIVLCLVGIGSFLLVYEGTFINAVPYFMLVANFAYVFSTNFYVTYVLTLAALEKREGISYLIVAVMMLSVFTTVHMFNMFGETIPPYFPFEIIILILMLALLLSLRFSNAFKKVDTLSKELLKVDQFKDEFLAKTSHEFKTPLHGIQNISQSMIKDSSQEKLSKEQIDNLSLIINIAKRLSSLVNDILELSKIKQGELKVAPVSLDVHGTVSIMLKLYGFFAKEKELELVNDIPKTTPYVLADEVRFRQIVSNLVDNAVKYTEQGEIRLGAKVKKEMVEISVADTGVGIEREKLQDIFTPFLQAGQGEGVGLGLSIVKQLVELQGGQIAVTSEKGKGTTFTFSLPIASNQETEALTAATNVTEEDHRLTEYKLETPYISEQGGKFTLLVVDDRSSNLKILIELLEAEHYDVIAVKNGEEALVQVRKTKIDLVILDLMMPGMSGYEVCEHIRDSYNLIEMPVLMVTASHHTEEKLASFQAGANDFLPKPFDISELKARVESLLMMKHSSKVATTLELAFLQSQIKPHFLYNVLNTISSLSYTDIEKSREVIANLADYLRGSFDFSNTHKLIPFDKEMDLVKAYVEIERARFRDKINMEYHIPSDLSLKLPPLVIQPLIENAIRHGICKTLEGGTVTLSVEKYEHECQIIIEDDGVGMTEEKLNSLFTQDFESKGVGLKNIKQRLAFFFGTSLEVESEQGVGTRITITLPYQEKEQHFN